jgi:hypothetical protein
MKHVSCHCAIRQLETRLSTQVLNTNIHTTILQAGRSRIRFPMRSSPPLTKMSTRNLPEDKGRPARRVDLTAICEPTVQKIWGPRRLTTLWTSTACYRDNFTYHERIDTVTSYSHLSLDSIFSYLNHPIPTFKIRFNITLPFKLMSPKLSL